MNHTDPNDGMTNEPEDAKKWTCFLCKRKFSTFNLQGEPIVGSEEEECPR
jgi:hypothetical protein